MAVRKTVPVPVSQPQEMKDGAAAGHSRDAKRWLQFPHAEEDCQIEAQTRSKAAGAQIRHEVGGLGEGGDVEKKATGRVAEGGEVMFDRDLPPSAVRFVLFLFALFNIAVGIGAVVGIVNLWLRGRRISAGLTAFALAVVLVFLARDYRRQRELR
jgi:hypothetical protein